MALIFPEELVIGVAEVDDQHRAFYAHLNRLHDAMRAHRLDEVLQIADFLVGYARDHFSLEERLMIDAAYPGFPDHLTHHAAFVKEIKRWKARLAERGPTAALVVELSSWLTRWLGDHIRGVDGKMAAFLRERGIPPGDR
jgi:hemerythrin